MEVLITEDVVTFTANYKIGITEAKNKIDEGQQDCYNFFIPLR